MRNRDTGESRGFAFVEFHELKDAIQWRQLTQVLSRLPSDMLYSIERQELMFADGDEVKSLLESTHVIV